MPESTRSAQSVPNTRPRWRDGRDQARLILDDRVPEPASPRRGLAVQDEGAAGSRDHLAAASVNVLRRRNSSTPRLAVADRLVFVWLLSPVSVGVERRHDCSTGNRYSMASDGLSTVLALEVASRGGRPKIPGEIRRLIRDMSLANRPWGAPRIHGELFKLGIEVAQLCPTARPARCSAHPRWASPSILPDVVFGRDR